jgi:hypothetical protein
MPGPVQPSTAGKRVATKGTEGRASIARSCTRRPDLEPALTSSKPLPSRAALVPPTISAPVALYWFLLTAQSSRQPVRSMALGTTSATEKPFPPASRYDQSWHVTPRAESQAGSSARCLPHGERQTHDFGRK